MIIPVVVEFKDELFLCNVEYHRTIKTKRPTFRVHWSNEDCFYSAYGGFPYNNAVRGGNDIAFPMGVVVAVLKCIHDWAAVISDSHVYRVVYKKIDNINFYDMDFTPDRITEILPELKIRAVGVGSAASVSYCPLSVLDESTQRYITSFND